MKRTGAEIEENVKDCEMCGILFILDNLRPELCESVIMKHLEKKHPSQFSSYLIRAQKMEKEG